MQLKKIQSLKLNRVGSRDFVNLNCLKREVPLKEQSFQFEEYPYKMSEKNILEKSDFRKKSGLYAVIEDPRVSNFVYQKVVVVQKNLLILTILIIFLSMVKYLMKSTPDNEYIVKQVLIIISICNLILLFLIVVRKLMIYRLDIDQKKIYLKQKNKQQRSLFRNFITKPELFGPLLFQLILLIPHPNLLCINFEYSVYNSIFAQNLIYSVNDLLSVLAMVKIYIIFRSLINLTNFSSPRASRLIQLHSHEYSFMFSIKCILHEYPIKSVAIATFLSIVVFGNSFRFSEGQLLQYNHMDATGFQNYENCYWFAFITMATIGYGDYTLKTTVARIIAVASAIFGVVLSSLLIVSLSQYLQMKGNQHRSHTNLHRLEQQGKLTNEVAVAIAQTIKTSTMIFSNHQPMINKLLKPSFTVLKKKIDTVKAHHMKIRCIVPSDNINQEMIKSFQLIRDNFKQIYMRQRKLKKYIEIIEQKKITNKTFVRQSFIDEVQSLMTKIKKD